MVRYSLSFNRSLFLGLHLWLLAPNVYAVDCLSRVVSDDTKIVEIPLSAIRSECGGSYEDDRDQSGWHYDYFSFRVNTPEIPNQEFNGRLPPGEGECPWALELLNKEAAASGGFLRRRLRVFTDQSACPMTIHSQPHCQYRSFRHYEISIFPSRVEIVEGYPYGFEPLESETFVSAGECFSAGE